MISVRMKSPGWGGFSIRLSGILQLLMIVLDIYVVDFTLLSVSPKVPSDGRT